MMVCVSYLKLPANLVALKKQMLIMSQDLLIMNLGAGWLDDSDSKSLMRL